MLIHSLDLPGIPKIASGKVREIFDLGEHLLLVATVGFAPKKLLS